MKRKFILVIIFIFLSSVVAFADCPATLHEGMLFCEDFENQINNMDHVGSTNGSIGNVDPPHAIVNENYNGANGYCSRIQYGYRGTGLYDQWVDVGESTTGEHYISYWYRLDPNYDTVPTGYCHKNMRFWHSGDTNMNDIVMEMHLYGTWAMDIGPQVNLQLTGGHRWGLSNEPNHANEFSTGIFNWHHVETYIKYDSPAGAGNGELKIWIDGNVALDRTGVQFTKPDYPSYTRFSIPSNKSQSTNPDYIFIDNVEVWDRMPGTTPSSCGDGTCDPDESCSSCPTDCGTCEGEDNAYYVNYDAADGGNGSINSPWNRIADVNSANLQPGDTVYFQRGDTWHEQLNIRTSGEPGNPITFGAYGSGAQPIIDGGDTRAYCIELDDNDNIVIQNLHLKSGNRANLHGYGSHNIIIEDVLVEEADGENAYFGDADNLVVRRSIFRNARGINHHGLYIGGGTNNPIIEYCEFANNGNPTGAGLKFNSSAGTAYVNSPIVRNNIFHHNGWVGIEDLASINAQYDHNLLYSNGRYEMKFSSDNEFLNIGSRNATFMNNTLVVEDWKGSEQSNYGIYLMYDDPLYAGRTEGGHTIKNNIIYGVSDNVKLIAYNQGIPNTCMINYNCYYTTANWSNAFRWRTTYYSSLASWRSASDQDRNSLAADPLFVDFNNHNYTPQSERVCGAGENEAYIGAVPCAGSLPQGLPGDVNLDGEVNSSDVNMVVEHILETLDPPLSGQGFTNADMDGNGIINILDVQAIVNMIL